MPVTIILSDPTKKRLDAYGNGTPEQKINQLLDKIAAYETAFNQLVVERRDQLIAFAESEANTPQTGSSAASD